GCGRHEDHGATRSPDVPKLDQVGRVSVVANEDDMAREVGSPSEDPQSIPSELQWEEEVVVVEGRCKFEQVDVPGAEPPPEHLLEIHVHPRQPLERSMGEGDKLWPTGRRLGKEDRCASGLCGEPNLLLVDVAKKGQDVEAEAELAPVRAVIRP